MVGTKIVAISQLDDCSDFWRLWEQHRNHLYHCCLKLIDNPTDAEDALSRAMLKAWEKVQKYEGEITNIKAWLTRLTHNLCIDIHRERQRVANQVENIEALADDDEQKSLYNCFQSDLEQWEKKKVIRHAIDNLPPKLRETFILHFYQELSYQEIAQQQDISYQNVCKRISQARGILRLELREYFIGEDDTQTELSVTTESSKQESFHKDAEVELFVGEITLSDSATKVEKEEIVFSNKPQDAELSVQPISAIIAAESDAKLEVKRDFCRWEDSALRVWQPALILAKIKCRILSDVGKQDLLHSQVWVITTLFELRWRVWMDSGGCQLH